MQWDYIMCGLHPCISKKYRYMHVNIYILKKLSNRKPCVIKFATKYIYTISIRNAKCAEQIDIYVRNFKKIWECVNLRNLLIFKSCERYIT